MVMTLRLLSWAAFNRKAMQFQLYQYFELASLLFALIFFRGLKRFHIGLFVPLLVVDNVVELLGENYSYFRKTDSYFIYNFYFFLGTPLSLLLFGRMLNPKGVSKHLLNAIVLLALLFFLLNFFFWQKPQHFNSYSCVLAMVLNIVFACLVLFRVATRENVPRSLFVEPYYPINAAVLLFSLVTLIVLGLQQYIAANKITLNQKSLYHALLPTANIVLYTGYILGFCLCQRQQKKSFSLS
jgi:hypothetical protein